MWGRPGQRLSEQAVLLAVASLVVMATAGSLMAAVLGVCAVGLTGLAVAKYIQENEIKGETEPFEEARLLAELHSSVAQTLILAIDAKDQNKGHVIRVQRYARALAEELGLSPQETEGVSAAALLHDIGKLAVPDYILKKRGPLTVNEMKKMRLHCRIGAAIIANIRFPYPVADAVRYHHERFDGSGYPEGLRGEEIPFASRVLGVVDSYESFIFRDPDAPGTPAEAMEMLAKASGILFDPQIVDAWGRIHLEVVGEEIQHESSDLPGAYSDIERAVKEGYSLDSLSETIASMTVVRDIGIAATEMLENQIQPATVIFWSVKGDQLVTYDELNAATEEVVPLGVGVHGWVATEQSSCVNLDVVDGPFSGCKIVAVPVILEGRTIGVLSVYREEIPFTDDEIRLVTATADRIRGSVRHAQELEAAKRDAGSDKLTGLANRHALEATFANLDDHSYSVVMIDVDNFKRVNDDFGHQAGDHVLVRIAAHLRRAFGSAHSVCRLGGDEFVVLLPGSYFKAHKMTREFRRRIAEDSDLNVYGKFGFGVSWGIAAAPEDALSLDDVMAAADRRMYATKARQKAGRTSQDPEEAPDGAGSGESDADFRSTSGA